MAIEAATLEFVNWEGSWQPASIPLRITREEWDRFFDFAHGWNGREESLFSFPRFTMLIDSSPLPIRNAVEREFGNSLAFVIFIRLRYSQRPKVFGPHRTLGLAEQKALNYLIENHAVELIVKPTGDGSGAEPRGGER